MHDLISVSFLATEMEVETDSVKMNLRSDRVFNSNKADAGQVAHNTILVIPIRLSVHMNLEENLVSDQVSKPKSTAHSTYFIFSCTRWDKVFVSN